MTKGWVSTCAGSTGAASVEGEQYRVADSEILVLHVLSNGFHDASSFMAKDCRELADGKKTLLEDNICMT